MPLTRVLFSPSARVYNLRLLLAAVLAFLFQLITFTGDITPLWGLSSGAQRFRVFVLPWATVVFMLLHHIITAFRNPRISALADYLGIVIEIILVVLVQTWEPRLWASYSIPFLAFSLVFRTATMAKAHVSKPFWAQSHAFLGGCPASHPEYTPCTILINRSLAGPFVRGEYFAIRLVRAVFLAILMVSVAIVAIYFVVLLPLSPKVYTREIAHPRVLLQEGGPFPPGNATVVLDTLRLVGNVTMSATAIDATDDRRAHDCLVNPAHGGFVTAQCPLAWANIENVQVTLAWPAQEPTPQTAYILPAQDDDTDDLLAYAQVLPVYPNSRQVAFLTWTQRSVISGSKGSLSSLLVPSTRPLFNMELYTMLFTNTSDETAATSISTITLVQREPYVTKFIEEYTTNSLLDGISTVGGFWTFVNGASVLVFGAGIMYFLFGRRPLSALGIVHLMQRRRLIQNWHEDFPALRSEGGQPGSPFAGVVAFIRERLLEVDGPVSGDAESQLHAFSKYTVVETKDGDADDEGDVRGLITETTIDLDEEFDSASVRSGISRTSPSPPYFDRPGFRLDDVPTPRRGRRGGS